MGAFDAKTHLNSFAGRSEHHAAVAGRGARDAVWTHVSEAPLQAAGQPNHSNNKGCISSDLAVGAFLTSFDTHRNLQLTATSSGRKLPKELGCRSTFPFTFT